MKSNMTCKFYLIGYKTQHMYEIIISNHLTTKKEQYSCIGCFMIR